MLTVTYDNSDKDLPAICVMQVDENAKYKCLKMAIGEQAELLYKALTDQDFKITEKYEAKVITRGNCMMCGKELTEGLFFCKECEDKANNRK